MKTVWVNRHNADGSVKPMSEWVCKEVNSKITHSEAVEGNRSKFFIFSANEAKKSGLSNLEYIGNQRGDGWFYVADGDLPVGGNENVLAWNLDAHKSVTFKASTLIHHYNRSVTHGLAFVYPCWQPIEPPKHLD